MGRISELFFFCWALMCVVQAMVEGAVTADQEKIIVDLHNEFRRKEGGSNIEVLRYNPKLAQLAQTWTDGCVYDHGYPPYDLASHGFAPKTVGQNLFAGGAPTYTFQDAVNLWMTEKADYDYNTLACAKGPDECGHYTQVVWGKTTDVGCGFTICPTLASSGYTNAAFIACNYGPTGNYPGEKPFLKGLPCTQCDSGKFFCNNVLCDKSCTAEGATCQCKAACKNGGAITADCKCQCKTGFMGPDCGEICRDKDPDCGANPGYPASTCLSTDPTWAFVKDSCPKMCKLCT